MKTLTLLATLMLATGLNAQLLTDSLFLYVPFNNGFKEEVNNKTHKAYGAMLVQGKTLNDSAATYLDGDNDWIDLGTNTGMRSIDTFTAMALVKAYLPSVPILRLQQYMIPQK
ncbi:MAG: hypothetical protein ACPGLV_07915 [Bacteroidia bacterium]